MIDAADEKRADHDRKPERFEIETAPLQQQRAGNSRKPAASLSRCGK
jgi:hypothetical protein